MTDSLRTTEEALRKVIKTRLETAEVMAFITSANVLINSRPALLQNHTAEVLQQMELYLAAHFLAMRERQLKGEKWGNASREYQGYTKINLQASLYGQTAICFDTTNTLATLGNGYAEIQVA